MSGGAGSEASGGWLERGGDRKNVERPVEGAQKPFC